MIHRLITYLHTAEIEYAIISGYKKLFSPASNEGDVDILIRKQDFQRLENILEAFCKQESYQVVQNYHQEVLAKNIFIFDPKTQDLLNLDVYGQLHRKGTQFYTEEDIFQSSGLYRGISVLGTHHEFIHYLMKKIDKDQLTETVFNYLYILFARNKKACISAIRHCFQKYQDGIITAFLQKQFSFIEKRIPELKRSIYSRHKIELKAYFLNLGRIWKRIVRPTGIAICFLGPDGSGKSTIINTLKTRMLPFRKTAYYHLKPIAPKESGNTVVVDPHKGSVYSKPKSFLKLLFFVYQYNKGWFRHIFFKKIRSTLVIFDRYYDDLKVDHKRFRYGGSKKWIAQFEKWIPKPTVYFVLTSTPEVIYARKQEVSLKALEHQIDLYNGLQSPMYHHIEVNRPVQEIVTEVYHILMKTLYERY